MVDLAQLGFSIDSRQARGAAADLDRMSGAASRAETGATRLGAAASRSGQQIGAVDRPARRATDALAGLGSAAGGAAGQLVAMAGAALGLRSLATAVDQYTTMSNTLRVLEGDQNAVNRALDQLNAIAGRTRAPLEATVQLYQRMKLAAGELGASQQQIMRFTENIGLALAQQGGSAQAASGALFQLSQAMAGGVVRAEEFNSILEGAYPIALAAARGIEGAGGSVSKLRQMMLDGELTSQQFFAGIISQTAELEKAFSTTTPTIAQAMGRLRDSFVMFVGEVDSAAGISASVAQMMILLSDNLDRVAVYAGVAATAWVGYRAAVALAAAGTFTLAGALTTLRAALARTGIGLVVVLVGELGFQLMEAVRKAGSFGAAMEQVGLRAQAAWYGMKSTFAYALADMARGAMAFLRDMSAAFNALFGTSIQLDNALGPVQEHFDRMGTDALASAQQANGALAEMNRKLAEVNEGGATTQTTVIPAITGVGKAAGGAAKKVDELAEAAKKWIDRIKTPMEKYGEDLKEITKLHEVGKLTGEQFARAQALINNELREANPLVSEMSDAWWDFLERGAADFNSFKDAMIGGFRSMLVRMIRLAAENRIAVGVTGSVGLAGTAASAATGGAGGNLMSGANLLSSLTSFGSSIMSGITAPLQAGVSAAMQNGLSAGFQAWNASANFGASGALGLGAQIGSYLGPAMLGMGVGNLISGGYSIGGNGNIVNGIGTAIGAAVLGPIGGLLGGALGGVANRLFGRKLKDTGIEGNFSTEDGFTGNSFQFYKGGLFRSNKTRRSALDAGVYDTLSDAFGGVEDSVAGMAETLGLATKALDGFNFGFKFSTKGMSGEEITARLQEEMQNAGEKMADIVLATGKYTRASETSLEAMTRLTTSLAGVNSIMDTVGHSFRAAGLAGADMASQLADLFGGLDAMASATESYFQSFYTEDQRRATATRQMTEQLAKLNVTMPRTREQYMQLVEAQNLSTERGREVYAALIQLAEGMNFVLPSVRNFSAEVAALAGTVSTELQTAISGAENAAQTYAQSARLWYQTAASLRTFLRDLNNSNLAFINPQQALRANQSYFDGLMTKVQGGDVEAAKALSGAAGDLLTSLRQTSRTQAEYAAAAARVTAGLNLAAGISDLEGANDDVMVSLYKEQISVLTSLQNFLQYQGLTEDAIKQLPKDLQAMVRDFDGSLATFDSSLASIEKALKEVSSFSYAALQERLKVNVDLIAKADVPDYIRGMLTAANEGIRSSIDFIIRKDLPPDMKWIAITGQSSMIKSVEALLSGKSSTRAIDLALKDISQRQVAVAAVLSSGMDDKQKRLLNILSGTTKGTLTLGGSFQFDPEKSFSVWYEAATKNAITNPISGLRDSLNQLRDAMNIEAKNRASLAMETYFSGLNKGANGTTYVTQADVNKLAGMAGISTAGKSFEQVRDAVANYDKSDAIKNMIRDEDGSKYLAPLKTNVADAFVKLKSTMAKYSVEFNMPSANIKKANGTIDPDYLEKVQLRESWGWKYMLTPQHDSWKAIYNSGIWDSVINANNALIAAQARVPKFAVGGSHMGGLRIVGERGPELEATGPSRIYSSRQTREMFSQDEIVSELKALREENRQLMMNIAASNSKTAKTLQKWDRIGQPAEQAATGNAA